MQKHTLCCSIVFLRALLKKDSKLKVFHFSLLSCLRGAICKAGRKKHFRWECFSDFPCFFPSTFVWVENRRNATWEGHILTTSCCVQNGSEAALFQPITKAPSLTPFHPSTQRVITRKYIFNNFLPPLFVLVVKPNSTGCICCVLYAAYTENFSKGMRKSAPFRCLSPWTQSVQKTSKFHFYTAIERERKHRSDSWLMFTKRTHIV